MPQFSSDTSTTLGQYHSLSYKKATQQPGIKLIANWILSSIPRFTVQHKLSHDKHLISICIIENGIK